MLKEQTLKSKISNGDKFEIDEKEYLVKKWPSGHKPIYSAFKKGSYRAHFNQKHCSYFPLRKDRSIVKQKKNYLFKVSEIKLHCFQRIAKMGTFKYQESARKRTGIEAIPSALRRRHKINHLPVSGLIPVKVYLEFKILAINYKRIKKSEINRPLLELSTLLYNHLFSLFSFQKTHKVKFAA